MLSPKCVLARTGTGKKSEEWTIKQTVIVSGCLTFYRAMHFSANVRSWDRMSSVRPSVRL